MTTFNAALWKVAAHQQRHLRRLAEQQEIRLKQRLWAEREKRVALVNAMTELLPIIAGNGDPRGGDYCLVCEHEGAHTDDCAYMKALDAVAEAGRSIDGNVPL